MKSRAVVPFIVALGISLVVLGLALVRSGDLIYIFDSVAYLQGARSLLANGTHSDAFGSPILLWPVGFSLFLAPLLKLGLTQFQAFLVLNLLALIVLVFTAYQECARLKLTGIRRLVVATIAVSPLITTLGMMALSDLLFTAGFFLCLHLTLRYGEHPSTGVLISLTLVASMLPLLRYIGGLVVPLFALASLWRAPRSRSNWIRTVSASGLMTVPFLVWNLRNWSMRGQAISHLDLLPPNEPLLPTLWGTLRNLLLQLLPTTWIIVPITLGVGYFGWRIFRSEGGRRLRPTFLLHGGAIALYLGALSWLITIVNIDAPDSMPHSAYRYVAPLIPSLLVLFAVSLDPAEFSGRTRYFPSALAIGLFLTAAIQTVGSYPRLVGWSQARSKLRDGVQALRKQVGSDKATVMSNVSECIYWESGLASMGWGSIKEKRDVWRRRRARLRDASQLYVLEAKMGRLWRHTLERFFDRNALELIESGEHWNLYRVERPYQVYHLQVPEDRAVPTAPR